MSDEQNEAAEQLSSYKQAILSDAIIALEANLSRDLLYYGVWKDKNGSETPLYEIIGFSVPCSYDKYISEWNRRFVNNTENNTFHDSTDREFLLREFRNGKKEITFDYEAVTLCRQAAKTEHRP